MASQSGNLIDRNRAGADEAERAILAALADAAPQSLTVPELARRALGAEGRQASREDRVRNRLGALVKAGRVRQQKRQYFHVGAGQLATVADPLAAVLAEQRAGIQRAAARAAYLAWLGELARQLDGRKVPPGMAARVGYERETLRQVQRAAKDAPIELFDRMVGEWSDDIARIEQVIRDVGVEKEQLQIADGYRRRWIAANQSKADNAAREVRKRRARLERSRDEIWEIMDDAPLPSSYGYSLRKVSAYHLDDCKRLKVITVVPVGPYEFLYRSGYDSRCAVSVTIPKLSLSRSEPGLTWWQLLPFLQLAERSHDRVIEAYNDQLEQLQAEKRRDPGTGANTLPDAWGDVVDGELVEDPEPLALPPAPAPRWANVAPGTPAPGATSWS